VNAHQRNEQELNAQQEDKASPLLLMIFLDLIMILYYIAWANKNVEYWLVVCFRMLHSSSLLHGLNTDRWIYMQIHFFLFLHNTHFFFKYQEEKVNFSTYYYYIACWYIAKKVL